MEAEILSAGRGCVHDPACRQAISVEPIPRFENQDR